MNTEQKLEEMRSQIDNLDDTIVGLLEKRAKIVREIAALKKANGIPLLDPCRESEIVARVTANSELPSTALEEVFDAILAMCKKSIPRPDSN